MFYDLSLRSFRVRFFSFYFIFIDAVTVVLLRFTLRIIFIEISFYLYFFLCHAPGTITFFHSFSFIYAFKICFHFTSDKSRGETLWGIRLVERFWASHALVHVHQSALPTFCEQFSSAYYEMSKWARILLCFQLFYVVMKMAYYAKRVAIYDHLNVYMCGKSAQSMFLYNQHFFYSMPMLCGDVKLWL